MVVAVTLTAIVLGMAAPAGAAPQASDSSALAAVASSCAGATTTAGDGHSRLEAMYCGINVVRRAYGLHFVRGNVPLNRSSLLKANAVRRVGPGSLWLAVADAPDVAQLAASSREPDGTALA